MDVLKSPQLAEGTKLTAIIVHTTSAYGSREQGIPCAACVLQSRSPDQRIPPHVLDLQCQCRSKHRQEPNVLRSWMAKYPFVPAPITRRSNARTDPDMGYQPHLAIRGLNG